jgi:hypothetical protein
MKQDSLREAQLLLAMIEALSLSCCVLRCCQLMRSNQIETWMTGLVQYFSRSHCACQK